MRAPSEPPLGLSSRKLRVVLVDAAAWPREALQFLLAAEGGFVVLGAAGDGAEAVKLVVEHRPDLVLVDLAWPRDAGLAALKHLRKIGPPIPTVVVADALTGVEADVALTLGARGIVLVGALPSVLYQCLRAVAEGAYWIGMERFRDAVGALRRLRNDGLRLPGQPRP